MYFCFLLFIVYCSLVFLNLVSSTSISFLNLKYEHSLSALPKLRDETSSVSLFSLRSIGAGSGCFIIMSIINLRLIFMFFCVIYDFTSE